MQRIIFIFFYRMIDDLMSGVLDVEDAAWLLLSDFSQQIAEGGSRPIATTTIVKLNL